MAVRLHYFNVNGIAEFIRYILHYGKVEFEDIRYNYNEWPIVEIKNTLPYGQFPLYEEGDKKLVQSIPIARYVAQKVGLVPIDLWEQAVLDSIVSTIDDFKSHFKSTFFESDPARAQELRSKFFVEYLPFFFSRFEKTLRENNGHFGGKLSWADFVFLGVIEAGNLIFNVELEKNYPTIKALLSKLRNLPGVKEYIEKRRPYVFEVNELQKFRFNSL